ncbi:MAG: glycogen/starch synthase [Deltaproteobacteria bacterium]|nr:glycogen/starch synthase [Deltaproteobacteria bacterium]
MLFPSRNPRILMVTPEVTYVPNGMSNIAHCLCAKAGGLADVSAALVSALFEQGADVHIALPDYRSIFDDRLSMLLRRERKLLRESMPCERIHLAEDRAFFYLDHVYSSYHGDNVKLALAFQREVINNIIPRVQPDLIHCNDWMTGLIPAVSRQLGIPSLFTIHNVHNVKTPVAVVEDRGIDVLPMWKQLYYDSLNGSYEEAVAGSSVDFLTSGIFAAHFVNTVSPKFLAEIADGRHDFIEPQVQSELHNKVRAGCGAGILNAPDPSYVPEEDKALARNYSAATHAGGKRENKRFLQKKLGLLEDEQAPLFFWPSRLDSVQKGCQLLAEILFEVVSHYWEDRLQIVFVGSGEYFTHFQSIVTFHNLARRVVVREFDEDLSRLAFGAADFILMPSRYEPCGLPQMIGPIYGALPIAHDTGGIHDTVEPLDAEKGVGNGFLFANFEPAGLRTSIGQAMEFFHLKKNLRNHCIERIMKQSRKRFNHEVTARNYIDLYEKMLRRPLVRNALLTEAPKTKKKEPQRLWCVNESA